MVNWAWSEVCRLLFQHKGLYLLTYLLTPWCRVLLEKLTGLQIVKKFPVIHGTRRFITALTSVRHLSLSWASPIQSIYPHPTSRRSILILSTHLAQVSPVVSFPRLYYPMLFYILYYTFYTPIYYIGDRGRTVVKVLCYKSLGRWFDPRCCRWNFSLT